VTSGLYLPVVRAGPEHREVVHPCGSQRSPWSTSLEGVPHGAVVGADLHVGVTGGSRGLPLLTLANGMLMERRSGSSGLCRRMPWPDPAVESLAGSRRDYDSLLHCSDGLAR
jgi:hypothetical protein